MMSHLKLFLVISLLLTGAACEIPQSPEASDDTDTPEAKPQKSVAAPYGRYCFAGKPRLPLSQTNPGDCILTISSGGALDIKNMQSTSFIARLSGYETYEEKGFKSFFITVKTPPGPPKASTGSYEYIPFDVYGGGPVPDVFAEGRVRIDNKERGTVMKPMADRLRNTLSPSEWPPLELVSAQLTITHAEDILPDEHDAKLFKISGIETGKQYIKGNMSFAIAKFGPGGKDFGPINFSFATTYEWTYIPVPDAE